MMKVTQWMTATTEGSTPKAEPPVGLVALGPWEPIGCGVENGRVNGGVEDMYTVFCWRRPLGDEDAEEPAQATQTANPTQTEIAELAALLRKAAYCTTIVDRPLSCEVAECGGRFYVAGTRRFTGGKRSGSYADWVEADAQTYDRAIEAKAVRQLLAERGTK